MQQQVNEVLIAQDGDEALLLETQSADLILTDLAMPHVNGYELYQQIKQATDPHLLLIPVILMSGRTLGSNTYYAKSMQGKLLAAKRLQSLFEGETSEREVITLIINEKSVRIDCRQHRVWIEDQEVELTAREVFLLERLAQQPNEIVSLVQLVKTTQ